LEVVIKKVVRNWGGKNLKELEENEK